MVTVSTLHLRIVRVPAVCREGREREKKRERGKKKCVTEHKCHPHMDMYPTRIWCVSDNAIFWFLGTAWANFETYLIIIAMACTLVVQMKGLNKGLAFHPAVYIVSVYQTFWIMGSIIVRVLLQTIVLPPALSTV